GRVGESRAAAPVDADEAAPGRVECESTCAAASSAAIGATTREQAVSTGYVHGRSEVGAEPAIAAGIRRAGGEAVRVEVGENLRRAGVEHLHHRLVGGRTAGGHCRRGATARRGAARAGAAAGPAARPGAGAAARAGAGAAARAGAGAAVV